MRGIMFALGLLVVVGLPISALALEAGGEFAVTLSGVLAEDGGFVGEVKESLELELFLPEFGDNELRYAFTLAKPVQDLLAGEEVSYFAKKAYLKHRFANLHLTVGRQPVSWAFGSLHNPVDYTLGSVELDEEYSSKYTDAVEAYIPLNWNSSLSLVASFPDGFTTDADKIKWGARARMGIKGYDVTLNYVDEAGALTGLSARQRLGLTFKGDLGDFGVYGAYGHYFNDEIADRNTYLVGADYSFNLNYLTKITLQAEYVDNLVAGSINYPIDDFSSASLITTVDLDNGNTVIIPRYQSTLPGGVDLAVDCTLSKAADAASVSLSYPF